MCWQITNDQIIGNVVEGLLRSPLKLLAQQNIYLFSISILLKSKINRHLLSAITFLYTEYKNVKNTYPQGTNYF